MVATRKPACSGCCACTHPALPVVPRPPTRLEGIAQALADAYGDTFHRPVDHLSLLVVHNLDLTAAERVELCRTYARMYSVADLADALDEIGRHGALPPEIAAVLDKVTKVAA